MTKPKPKRISMLETLPDRHIPGQAPPVAISVYLLYYLESLRARINREGLCMMLYCSNCKNPIDLVYYSDELFICPKCGRNWVKDDRWKDDIEELGLGAGV